MMKLIVVVTATVLLSVAMAHPTPDEEVAPAEKEALVAATKAPKKACACTMLFEPVCGANGVTYGNDCMRKCNNIRLLHRGECDDDDCVCTQDYDPVCGDDGTTYINDCNRECSGVNLDHDGSC